MSGLLQNFYDLYEFILNNQGQVAASQNKDQTSIEISNGYLNKLTQIKQEMSAIGNDAIKERFFYVMIGMYDAIMIQYLTKNFSIGSGLFDSAHSLEVRCYNTARFGDKFFIDVKDTLDKNPDQQELLKVYLNIINIIFKRQTEEIKRISYQIFQSVYGKVESGLQDPFLCESPVQNSTSIFNVNYSSAYIIVLSIFYIFSSCMIWFSSTNIIKEKIGLINVSKK